MGSRDLLDDLTDAGFSIKADGENLVIRPASKLTDDIREALRTAKPELMRLLSAAAAPVPPVMVVRTCTTCLHMTRHRTCTEPVAAGLAPNFAIRWPPAGYGASCAAFTPKPEPEPAGRAYALTQAQGDVAHADAWDEGANARFEARTAAIRRRGFDAQDAKDLAEQLHLRDVRADHRHACLECRHLAGSVSTGWRCGNHKAANINRELATDLVVMHQYCPGFSN